MVKGYEKGCDLQPSGLLFAFLLMRQLEIRFLSTDKPAYIRDVSVQHYHSRKHCKYPEGHEICNEKHGYYHGDSCKNGTERDLLAYESSEQKYGGISMYIPRTFYNNYNYSKTFNANYNKVQWYWTVGWNNYGW